MDASPLKVVDLVKNYGENRAVNRVSFELKKGEIFGLLGPNGAGKTSLISCVVTLEEPTSGQIFVAGHDVTKQPSLAKQKIGFVGQEVVNTGYFNVEEILQFQSGYYGLKNNGEKIEELLYELGLAAHRKKKVKQLSGGMKRRLMIAKSLVHQPQLLLLDEPTAGVDVELRENLWRFVRRLQSEGITILLTTHYLEEAEELCDRVGVIHKGELRKIGPTQELIQELTEREVRIQLKNGEQRIFFMKKEDDLGARIQEFAGNLSAIDDISIREGSLEEAFRHIIGERALES